MRVRWYLTALLIVTVGAAVIVVGSILHGERQRGLQTAAASVEGAREARLQPFVEVAPAPVPKALPLVGGEGTTPDGYPVAYVDLAGLRSLLWHRQWADLDRYFSDDLRLHQQLDYALAKERKYSRVIEMWTEYLGRHADEGRAYLERGGAYHNLGKRNEARADAARACDLGITEGCARAR